MLRTLVPSGGGMVLLHMDRRISDSVLTEAVAEELSRSAPVHWVDGACRIDPARFIAALRMRSVEARDGLSRLFVSRGFTLHQLVHQISRLGNELSLTGARMAIIDGMLDMFLDHQIGDAESRALFRLCLARLHSMVESGHIIIVTSRVARDGGRDQILQTLLSAHCERRIETVSDGNGRWLRIEPEGLVLPWLQLPPGQRTLHEWVELLPVTGRLRALPLRAAEP